LKTLTTTTIFCVRSLSLLLIVLGLVLVLSGIFVAGLTDTAKADSVISTIPVGTHPQGLAFDPANGEIYVANANSNTISVISSSTNQVIATIPLNMQPRYIVFDSANKNMYVAGVIIVTNPIGTSSDTLALSVISSSTNQVIATMPIAGGSQEVGDIGGIAFDPANGNIFVTSILTNTAANVNMDAVLVFSTSSNKVIATLSISGPEAVAFDPANGDVYVESARSNTLNVIDPATNQVLLPLIHLIVTGIAFDSANGDLYMTGLSTVSVLSSSTNQVIATIPVGTNSLGIAYDSANGNMYAANYGDNTVSVLSSSTNQVIATIPVGTHPRDIAYDSANGEIYVANTDSNTVSVISTATTQLIPPDTTITSARDGNGATIQNGGTTLSTSIQFTFTATPGTNPIAGFECRLDNSAFSPCTSPTTLTNLPAGKHNFQVRAVDTAGNRDPTPASFSWNILTPAQGIQQLIQLIQSMGLNHGTQTSLTALLNAALSQLTNNNPNSVGTACNQLNAFVNHVNADGQNGQLSSSQAAQLIQSAQAIRTALHC
jgi:YVTN family beta-propeller protein